MSGIPQFGLMTLVVLTTFVALLVGLTMTDSDATILLSSTGLTCLIGAVMLSRRFGGLAIGAVMGFTWPAAILCAFVTHTIWKAETIQGELYHEDGSFAFFVIAFLLLVFSSGVGALVGSLFGWTIEEFLKWVAGKETSL